MFIDSQRQHCLDLLHHLHDDTTGHILVEGASGLGKTTLLKQFKAELREQDLVISLDYKDAHSLRSSTFLALCKHWKIQDVSSTPNDLALVKLLQESTKNHALTLIVDNVRIISEDDVQFLSFLQTVQLEKPCHAILAGPTGLAEHHLEFNYQVITLLPFTEHDTGEFVAWLESSGTLTTIPVIRDDIFKSTGGNPAKIISLLSGNQDLVATSKPSSAKISSNQFIVGSTALLIVLFVGLNSISNEPTSTKPTENTIAAHPDQPTKSTLEKAITTQHVAGSPKPSSEITEPDLERPGLQPSVAKDETASPLPKKPKLTKQPNNEFLQEQWLLSQSPKYFTWQLVLNRQEQAARDFIRHNNIQQRAGYYRKFVQDKYWYSVVYGIYPSIREAEAALEKLPNELKLFAPWRRTIRDVHKEIAVSTARTDSK